VKNLKTYFIICATTLLLCHKSIAQKIEIGIMGGGANYTGDLNTNTSFQKIGPSAGIFMRNNIGTRFSFKHAFAWGRISADDALSKNDFQKQRNLSFRSDIFEISEMFEFNFLDFLLKSKKYFISPYISTGICVFFFNPQAFYQGKWHNLQPLGTEGQNDPNYSGNKKYKLYNIAIPIGGGVKVACNRYWSIGIDIQNRVTFTDYLDDVSKNYVSPISLPDGNRGIAYKLMDRSGEKGEVIGKPGYQRGLSEKNDHYMFFSFTLSYTFNSKACPKPYPEH
jgi:hypothetical protein